MASGDPRDVRRDWRGDLAAPRENSDEFAGAAGL